MQSQGPRMEAIAPHIGRPLLCNTSPRLSNRGPTTSRNMPRRLSVTAAMASHVAKKRSQNESKVRPRFWGRFLAPVLGPLHKIVGDRRCGTNSVPKRGVVFRTHFCIFFIHFVSQPARKGAAQAPPWALDFPPKNQASRTMCDEPADGSP